MVGITVLLRVTTQLCYCCKLIQLLLRNIFHLLELIRWRSSSNDRQRRSDNLKRFPNVLKETIKIDEMPVTSPARNEIVDIESQIDVIIQPEDSDHVTLYFQYWHIILSMIYYYIRMYHHIRSAIKVLSPKYHPRLVFIIQLSKIVYFYFLNVIC